MTVYNFDTIDVDGKPEEQFKCLKKMVGERGFEPPTPWSRTRCSTRLSHSPTMLRMALGPPPSALFSLIGHCNYNIVGSPTSYALAGAFSATLVAQLRPPTLT